MSEAGGMHKNIESKFYQFNDINYFVRIFKYQKLISDPLTTKQVAS